MDGMELPSNHTFMLQNESEKLLSVFVLKKTKVVKQVSLADAHAPYFILDVCIHVFFGFMYTGSCDSSVVAQAQQYSASCCPDAQLPLFSI